MKVALDWETEWTYSELVANAVALQTVVDQTQAPHSLKSKGVRIDPADLAFLSPYPTSKLKRFGDFRLTSDLRPFRLRRRYQCNDSALWQVFTRILPAAHIRPNTSSKWKMPSARIPAGLPSSIRVPSGFNTKSMPATSLRVSTTFARSCNPATNEVNDPTGRVF